MIELAISELHCAYRPLGQVAHDGEADGHALATVCFAADTGAAATSSGAPWVRVPMAPLDAHGDAGATCEIWSGGGSASFGQQHGVHYGHNDHILFGAVQLDEAQFAPQGTQDGKSPLQRATHAAYQAIFAAADALGFVHILRFWNYMADINGHSHGIERYRQFNMGRQDGFLTSGRAVAGAAVPAASAVGFSAGPLTIYFLAGRDVSSTAIENPRQVSAYSYPTQYGPRSPTFSRASLAHLPGKDVLFLSGTASIVGHRTLHAGDVVAQVRETLANIDAMVEQANRVATQTRFALADLCYKVYVRHEADVAAIETELRRAIGASARLMFLKADICRHDLLMEIEATAGHPLDFGPIR